MTNFLQDRGGGMAPRPPLDPLLGLVDVLCRRDRDVLFIIETGHSAEF